MGRTARFAAVDARLVEILDATAAEALRRSGAWIACRLGCTQCCLGTFEITPLDVVWLREGLRQLATTDLARAQAIRDRAVAYRDGDDEPCPALDPATGACDLYLWRPVTCREFGPAIRREGEVGACELCYVGARDEEIAECAVELDREGLGLESRLIAELEAERLTGANTVASTVAAALLTD